MQISLDFKRSATLEDLCNFDKLRLQVTNYVIIAKMWYNENIRYKSKSKIKELRVAQEQAYNILFRYHNNLADSLNKQWIADMLDYICGWCAPEKYIWGNRGK